MREQVDAAHAAAERLVQEAEAAARERAAGVPPRGWSGPADPADGAGSTIEALRAILGLLDTVRGAIPPELAEQFAAAARELLVAVRALIDFYLERLDRPAPSPREVEDIPID
jgi:hypothetical protein